MKYYLIGLLLLIMAAGARTMFEIAHHALGREHDFGPEADTTRLIFLALWYVLMMVVDVLLLNYRQIRYHFFGVALLSIGVTAPTIYMFLTHS